MCAFALLFSLASFSVNAAEWDRPTYSTSTIYDTTNPSQFAGYLSGYPAFIGSTTYTAQGDEITVTGTNGWTTTTTTDGQAVLMYTISGAFRFSSIGSYSGYLENFKVELGLTSGFPNVTLSIVNATAEGMSNVGRALQNGALVLNFQRAVSQIDMAVRAGESIRIPYEITVAVYIPTSNNSISTASKLKDYITSCLVVEMNAILDGNVFQEQGNLNYREMEDLQDADHAFQLDQQQAQQEFEQDLTEQQYANDGGFASNVEDTTERFGATVEGQLSNLFVAEEISRGLMTAFSTFQGREAMLVFPEFDIDVQGITYPVWGRYEFRFAAVEEAFPALISAVRFALVSLCYINLVRYLYRMYERLILGAKPVHIENN